MMDIPRIDDLIIRRGVRWQVEFTYSNKVRVPIDLNGANVVMTLKSDLTKTTPDLVLSTFAGSITIQGGLGKFTVTIPQATTATLTDDAYHFDIALVYGTTPNEQYYIFVEGTITVRSTVGNYG